MAPAAQAPAAKSGKSNLLLAGGGGDSDRRLDDGRIDVLRSPWIARLASSAGDPAGMCRAPFDNAPSAAATSSTVAGMLHPEHLVAGFGPFQINSGPDRRRRSDPQFPPYLPSQRMVETLEGDRNRRWRAANGGGGVRLSPFFRRLHPPPPARSAAAAGAGLAGEGGRLRLLDHTPSAPGGSMRRFPTLKGNGEETPTRRMFDVSYPALLHHPHERLVHAPPSREPKEKQQPLPSLWNMGRFKAEDMRPSVAAPIASAATQLSGKRRVAGAGGRLPLKNQRPSGWIFATPSPPPPPSSQSPAAPRAP